MPLHKPENSHNNASARWLAASLSAMLLVSCGPSAGKSGLNLIVICIDMARYDYFLAEDIKDELSPWLERAQVYDNAKTTAPWTMPSVSSVFTGLWPAQHGAGALAGPVANLSEQTPSRLEDRHTTLAEVLQQENYRTHAFVEHPWFSGGFGLDQGFDDVTFAADTDNLIDAALDWIDGDRSTQPFYTYLHFMDAHERHRASKEELIERFSGYDEQKLVYLQQHASPPVCVKPQSRRCLRNQAYIAVLLELRQTIAGILQSLETGGVLNNSLVLLYSDHGESFREHTDLHRELYEDPRGMYGVGHGQAHFGKVLDIPLIIWHPELAGARHDDLVSLVDIFPSLLDWLDLAYSADDLPGYPLPPLGLVPPDRVVYSSNIAFGPESLAIINGQYKALYWPAEDHFLFFDRLADPAESKPFESDKLIPQFSTLAGDYLELGAQNVGSTPDVDAAQLNELQSIGYLQGAEEGAGYGQEDLN